MIETSHAKVNIFLKVVGKQGAYHTIVSRFMRVEGLYDTLSFQKKEHYHDSFELEGDFSCSLEKNTIYKAYQALSKAYEIGDFFKEYKVLVKKDIPEFAGLGGGSSNAAAFLRLTNRILGLDIDVTTLASIGSRIGADVAFFVYNYPSATVSGIGEIVTPYEEEPLLLETFTPKISCDTAKVYGKFREAYLATIESNSVASLIKEPSKTVLEAHDAYFLNDLFAPALDLYPALRDYHDKNFFSGSGSTFFRMKDG